MWTNVVQKSNGKVDFENMFFKLHGIIAIKVFKNV